MQRIHPKNREMPSLRRVGHCMIAGGLYYSGLLNLYSWWRRRLLRRREVVVIGLHRVLTQEEASRSLSEPAIILLLPTYERVLQMLRQHYRVLGLNELETFADGDTSRPLCLITFDDGWRDTFENAFPPLQGQDLLATLFVATGLVGQSGLFWVERLTRLWGGNASVRQSLIETMQPVMPSASISTLSDAIAALKLVSAAERENLIQSAESKCADPTDADAVDWFMSWVQAKAAAEVLDIGSHTVTHPLLTHEKDADVAREVSASKSELERRLEERVTAFAYPSGDHDERVRLAVQKAGYTFAFTTRAGVYRFGDDRLTVPRVLLHEGNVTGLTGRFSPAMLRLRLTGWRLSRS